jgi:hypothetical protein
MSASALAALALLAAAPLLVWRRSRALAALYLGAAIAWLAFKRSAGGPAYAYWLLLAPAAPALRWPEQRDAAGRALAWSAVLAVYAGALYSLEIRARDLAALLFPAVAAAIHAWGARRLETGSPRAQAAHHLGALGVIACVALFCRPQAWGFAGQVVPPWPPPALDVAASVAGIAGFGGYALVAAARALRERAWHRALAGGLPLAVIPGLAIVHTTFSKAAAATWLLVYGLALAAALAHAGQRRAGAALAALLLALRLSGQGA